MRAALHQRPDAALTAEARGDGDGLVRRRRLDQFATVERCPGRGCHSPPGGARADQDGLHSAMTMRFERTQQAVTVARPGDRDRQWRGGGAAPQQLIQVAMVVEDDVLLRLGPQHDAFGWKACGQNPFGNVAAPGFEHEGNRRGALGRTCRHRAIHDDPVTRDGIGDETQLLGQDLAAWAGKPTGGEVQYDALNQQDVGGIRQVVAARRCCAEESCNEVEGPILRHMVDRGRQPNLDLVTREANQTARDLGAGAHDLQFLSTSCRPRPVCQFPRRGGA
jgi:hypothetical protein